MYVFIGLPNDAVSPGLFMVACLLAKGRRLPLDLMFLGNLYTWLDQAKEQLKTSFSHFDVNSFVATVFLQCFLFEHFPTYAPVRVIPEVIKKVEHPLEHHA